MFLIKTNRLIISFTIIVKLIGDHPEVLAWTMWLGQ